MSISRRDLLTRAAAAGTVAAAGSPGTAHAAVPDGGTQVAPSRAKVIDVHTHMFSEGWIAASDAAKNTTFRLGEPNTEGGRALLYKGNTLGTLVPKMLDYEARIRYMDESKIDIALISLTAPNVFWGTREQSTRAARAINDDFAAAARKYDGRIRWMASLPWQFPDEALLELKRAKQNGAIGVCTLTHVDGRFLVDPLFRPIWREIEAMRLPVFIHPTAPPGDSGQGFADYGFFNSIGFMSDTTACFQRMIWSGFLDEFPRLELIACHGGGTIPWLLGRFDIMFERGPWRDGNNGIREKPSTYIRRIHFDNIVYTQGAMDFLVQEVGADRVLFGSDYPFLIADAPGVLARTDRLPPAVRDAVRSGNALKIFDL